MMKSKEVTMTRQNKGQQADQPNKKYLWFGYGNYSANPNLQIGGGNIRDPGLFAMFFRTEKIERSPMIFFVYILAGLIGLAALTMLLAWGVSLLLS